MELSSGDALCTTARRTGGTKRQTGPGPDMTTFMGWTANSSWASDSAPGDLFNGTTPTITGNITFYAVFADEE